MKTKAEILKELLVNYEEIIKLMPNFPNRELPYLNLNRAEVLINIHNHLVTELIKG